MRQLGYLLAAFASTLPACRDAEACTLDFEIPQAFDEGVGADQSILIEDVRGGGPDDGEVELDLEVQKEAGTSVRGTARFAFIGSDRGAPFDAGTVYTGFITPDVDGEGASLALDLDGRRVFHAGNVFFMGDGPDAYLTPLFEPVDGPCHAGLGEEPFSGVRLNSDEPQIVASGDVLRATFDGVPYVFALPWLGPGGSYHYLWRAEE